MIALAVLALSVSLFAQAQHALSVAARANINYASALNLALDVSTRLQLNPAGDYSGSWQSSGYDCLDRLTPCLPQQLATQDKSEVLAVAALNLPKPTVEVSPCANFTCVAVRWGDADCAAGECLQLSFVRVDAP